MCGSIVFACLLVATPQEDLTLHAQSSGGGQVQYAFDSKLVRAEGDFPASTITDVLTNYLPSTGLAVAVAGDAKAVVGKAKQDGGRVTPASVTMARTTYRPVTEGDGGVEGQATEEDREFAFPANRWVERDKKVVAVGGAKLEATLAAGDRMLVRCVSDVAYERDNGYRYTYTVENLGDRPVRVKWGGVEGEVKPKDKLTKTLTSAELTAEESALMGIEFEGEKRPFAIRANRWAMPK
jgi:hypothetical protein